MLLVCTTAWLPVIAAPTAGGAAATKPVAATSPAVGEPLPAGGIPIRFKLSKAGYVTLVIEDGAGNRVRNLVAATLFPAGDNVVWWDGMDESVRVPYVEGNKVGIHGIYKVGGRMVDPGQYRVRGLVRDAVTLRYDFTAYPNCANPPWRVEDGSGAWLSDHTPPADTEYVPAIPGVLDQPRVYISAAVAEAGSGLIWTDLNGRKINGVRWIGGHWTGASHLARDNGSKGPAEILVYTASGWRNDKEKSRPELRVNAMTPAGARDIFKWSPAPEKKDAGPGAEASAGAPGSAPFARVAGLAARDGLVAVAEGTTNQLFLIQVAADAKRKTQYTGSLVASLPLKDARDLAFDGQGRLLALFATELRRYTLPAAPTALGAGELLVKGLDDARRLAQDKDGNLYISQWGAKHQVEVFGTGGQRLRAVGEAGQPRSGPYQANHMNRPLGLTVTPEGQLWVAEDDLAPKRVSVWNATGQLVRDMIGPPAYGGGGWLDPLDKNRLYLHHGDQKYGGGMEFQLDWDNGTAKLANIYHRSGAQGSAAGKPGTASLVHWGSGPDVPLVINGERFLTNAFSANPTGGARFCTLWRLKNGLASPLVAAGATTALPAQLAKDLGDRVPAQPKGDGDGSYLLLGVDTNGDGQLSSGECTITPLKGRLSAVSPARDGSLIVTLSNSVLKLAPTWTNGMPAYDAAKAEVLTSGYQIRASSGGEAVVGQNGRVVVTNGPMEGFVNGVRQWYYHNPWPGLHAGHRAPARAAFPGQLIAPTRLLGYPVTPRSGEAGELWGVNSDKAVMYLTTMDGLFLAQLGDLDPNNGWRQPRWERGMDISQVNFIGENFFPSLNQTADGAIYLVAGKEHCSLVRIDGLDSVKRLGPWPLDVNPNLLAQADKYQQAQAAAAAGPALPLTVKLKTAALTVDGDFKDWAGAQWVVIDAGSGQGSKAQRKVPTVEGAAAIAGGNLYVALRSRHLGMLTNAAQAPQELFKTGGGLDVMLGSGGAKRLLLALKPDGKTPVATLFQPVAPGTDPAKRVAFASPWRTINFDLVEDISRQVQLKVKLIREKDSDGEIFSLEQIEAAIPLALTGIDPKAGTEIKADLGILRGSATETLQRLYWSNKATGLMNDVPGEAQLTPAGWGTWKLESEPATP